MLSPRPSPHPDPRPLVMPLQAKRILVRGRVQGVGFRYFVHRAAERLGLAGSVRNRPDRTVEILVEGEEALVGEFVTEVGKGPSLSRVDGLEIHESAPGARQGFQIEGW